jgi:hypothetical protein
MNTVSLYNDLFNAGVLPWEYSDLLKSLSLIQKYKLNTWLLAKWIQKHCQSKSIKPQAFALQSWVNMYLEWQRIV